MTKILFCFIALIAISGCNGSVNKNQMTGELNTNRALWQSMNLDTYSYITVKSCFCPPPSNQKIKITVVDGTITEAQYDANEEMLGRAELQNLLTIPQWFDKVDSLINTEQPDELKVTYNSQYGYPESISVDYIKMAIDDEVGYSNSELSF